MIPTSFTIFYHLFCLILENSLAIVISVFHLLLIFQLYIYYNFWNCSTVLGGPVMFFPHSFFSLCFNPASFYYLSSSSQILFSAGSILPMSPLETFFISVTVPLIPTISFWFFLRAFFSLLTLSVWYYIMSAFSISVLNVFIIVTLNCLIIPKFVLYLSLALMLTLSLLYLSPISLASLATFGWKLDMLHWIIGSLVSKSVVWGFMLICFMLKVGMCLMFAIAVGARRFKFL